MDIKMSYLFFRLFRDLVAFGHLFYLTTDLDPVSRQWVEIGVFANTAAVPLNKKHHIMEWPRSTQPNE